MESVCSGGGAADRQTDTRPDACSQIQKESLAVTSDWVLRDRASPPAAI